MMFTTAFSLGSECETAFMMREFFNRPTTSPFDWLVTPLRSVIDILSDRGERFGQTLIPIFGGTSILCGEYGVLYHHEYERKDGIAVITQQAIAASRSKLLHKRDNVVCQAREGRTLFIRGGVATGLPGDLHIQRDPFDFQFFNEVIWASEDKLLSADVQYNLRWVTELFGEDVASEIGSEMASCCGTTIGTATGMMSYLNDICSKIETTEFDRGGVYEQGFHNYLIHAVKPDYGYLETKFNIFATVGTVSPERISLNVDNEILVDGRLQAVIHQWDRHDKLTQLISKAGKFRIR